MRRLAGFGFLAVWWSVMDIANDLLGVVKVLAGAYVTFEVIFMIARLAGRAVSQAGR